MALFGWSAEKVTNAMRPYCARSSLAGTWEYLEEQAESTSVPQSASACCNRTGRFALFLSIWAASVGDFGPGGRRRARGSYDSLLVDRDRSGTAARLSEPARRAGRQQA